jgi:hypothetical protein
MFGIENQASYNITLVLKNEPFGDDEFSSGTYKLDFENSTHQIKGEYMIIESKNNNEIIGKVFHMKSIKSYKLWQ